MNCLNCGRPTVGNAVLCHECAAQAHHRSRSTSVIVLSILLALSVLMSVCLLIYLISGSRERSAATAQLRVQQEMLDRRAYQLTQSEGETDALNAQLEQLQAENADLRNRINELDNQLGAVDSERNQSTSNYIQQVAELEQQLRQLEGVQATMEEALTALQEENNTLTEDNETLTEDLETLHDDYELLEKEMDNLQDRYDLLVANYRSSDSSGVSSQILTYKKKADFLDTYIVFVQNDGSKYYHTYDCSHFTGSDFCAYNRALAKSEGYSPCPYCN